MSETGTPGTFTGTVATLYDPDPAAPRTSNDGAFPVRDGDVLTATYDDALTAAGGTASPTDDATITGGDDGTVTISAHRAGRARHHHRHRRRPDRSTRLSRSRSPAPGLRPRP